MTCSTNYEKSGGPAVSGSNAAYVNIENGPHYKIYYEVKLDRASHQTKLRDKQLFRQLLKRSSRAPQNYSTLIFLWKISQMRSIN